MANSVKFELNLSGLNELMKSGGMQNHLEDAGRAVAAAAGDEYGVEVITGNYISAANVYPNSQEAAIENYRKNTLLKALGSVGLNMNK